MMNKIIFINYGKNTLNELPNKHNHENEGAHYHIIGPRVFKQACFLSTIMVTKHFIEVGV